MMDIPVSARVLCSDGPAGHSTYVVINPTSKEITDVVVKHHGSEHLVPVGKIVSSTPEEIRLDCSREDLKQMQPFLAVEFVSGEIPHPSHNLDEYTFLWNYDFPPVSLEPKYIPVEHEQIPLGELALRQHVRVEAVDGVIGHVSEFVIDPANERITHLVLRKGHLWNTHEVVIPVQLIKKIKEETVYLSVDKNTVGMLPAAPAGHPIG